MHNLKKELKQKTKAKHALPESNCNKIIDHQSPFSLYETESKIWAGFSQLGSLGLMNFLSRIYFD
jgi:hypothetical protein